MARYTVSFPLSTQRTEVTMQSPKPLPFPVLGAFSVPPGSSLLAVFASLLAFHSYLHSTTLSSVAPPVRVGWPD